ncbi:ribosome recycling factor [Luteolibacter ambystomatis]|uniref:Ribosome-recycling factor n=1 Tax=Luteolibacter ambystomatis TaxID=2824561 RepID=A0A975PGI9_9BACT|nr:ribosome recycling factor [Luteolibacter ambystomatis]QUE52347.1 ribosome recycling factor [Luteolibacter ambystomatis]
MSAEDTLLETDDAMQKAVEYLLHEFSAVRTGKATPALIENIDVFVRAYNSVMKLKGLAIITTPDARMLEVKAFDPSTTQDIERAIRESKLGLNPAAAGSSLRIPIPELSEERRRDMVKLVKQLAEEAKVRIRAARKEGIDSGKKLKASNLLTEDGQKDLEEEIQEYTNKYVKEIDSHTAHKEAELMKV